MEEVGDIRAVPGSPAAVVIKDFGEQVVINRGAGFLGLLVHIVYRAGDEGGFQVYGVHFIDVRIGFPEGIQDLLATLFAVVLLNILLPLFHGQLAAVAKVVHHAKLGDDRTHHGGNLQGRSAEIALQGIAGVVGVGLGGPAHLLALFGKGLGGLVHCPDKLGHRHFFQAFHFRFGDVQVAQDLQHQFLGRAIGVKGVAGDDAGHDDHLVEQALSLGDLPQHGDFATAAGLAKDGHIARVTAKTGNVVPHPAERLHQVGHAYVDRVLILAAKIGEI